MLPYYMQFAYIPLLQFANPLRRNKENASKVRAPHRSPCSVRTTQNVPASHSPISPREPFQAFQETFDPPILRAPFQPRFASAPGPISHFLDRTTYATCFSRNSLQTKDGSKIRSQINSTPKTHQKRPLQNIIASPPPISGRPLRPHNDEHLNK